MTTFARPEEVMRRALELARRGLGSVEPNPMVGAVLVDDRLNLLGEGWHERYGGPHAEINALAQAGSKANGATLFVTLEPCCHFGKTPPCSRAVSAAGVRKVVAAMHDPAPHVQGGGIAELRAAGIEVEIGLLEAEAQRLVAPFVKLMTTGRPWVHAKWAMTLDGKLASRTGHSQWISNEASRRVVHQLRGRMDGIVVGIGTVLADDPLLTARPSGPRVATRIVVDSQARLPLTSQLARTASAAPVLVAVRNDTPPARIHALQELGIEVLPFPSEPESPRVSLRHLLDELGRRRLTNLLVEGGSQLLGAFFDQSLIDEVHAFLAPKLVGGSIAPTPMAGLGLERIPEIPQFDRVEIEVLEGDVYVHGRLIPASMNL